VTEPKRPQLLECGQLLQARIADLGVAEVQLVQLLKSGQLLQTRIADLRTEEFQHVQPLEGGQLLQARVADRPAGEAYPNNRLACFLLVALRRAAQAFYERSRLVLGLLRRWSVVATLGGANGVCGFALGGVDGILGFALAPKRSKQEQQHHNQGRMTHGGHSEG
jgi:hypothetical protein